MSVTIEYLEKHEKLADRLEKMAAGLDQKIEKKRNCNLGLPLTHRRQRQIDSARQDADEMERVQLLMNTLAGMWRVGSVPDFLAKVKTKTAVVDLEVHYRMAKRWPDRPGQLQATLFNSDNNQAWAIIWATGLLDDVDHDDRDAQREIARLTAEMELSRPPGYFSTPPAVYELMFSYVYGSPKRILEPEAGSGALADGIKERWPEARIDCIEVNWNLRKILELKGYTLVGHDFLEFEGEPVYDAVIMNPPFENGQDGIHIQHAYSLLAPGGTLVSVCSPSLFTNRNGRSKLFSEWFEEVNGYAYDLPAGSFLPATGVSSKFVVIEKNF